VICSRPSDWRDHADGRAQEHAEDYGAAIHPRVPSSRHFCRP
jgi:hypothetical protein